MKTPTVIIIVVVVAMLGFLLMYSQQASTPADRGEVAVSEPVQSSSAGSEGAAQITPAAPSGEQSK